MPDPFDYERGIARFHGVGKYEALNGVDVRGRTAHAPARPPGRGRVLQRRGRLHPRRGRERRRVATPGAASGSRSAPASAVAGSPTAASSIPATRPAGASTSSSSAGTGSSGRCRAARSGVPTPRRPATATRTSARSPTGHATATARAIGGAGESPAHAGDRRRTAGVGFGADVVVVGGSMTGSWDLLGPWFLSEWDGPPVRLAADSDTAGLGRRRVPRRDDQPTPMRIRGCCDGSSQRRIRTSWSRSIDTQPCVGSPTVTCRKNALPAPCTTGCRL